MNKQAHLKKLVEARESEKENPQKERGVLYAT